MLRFASAWPVPSRPRGSVRTPEIGTFIPMDKHQTRRIVQGSMIALTLALGSDGLRADDAPKNQPPVPAQPGTPAGATPAAPASATTAAPSSDPANAIDPTRPSSPTKQPPPPVTPGT